MDPDTWPGVHPPGAAFYIGFGYPVRRPRALCAPRGDVRRSGIVFAGQITHDRRVDLVEVLPMDDGLLVETQAFGTDSTTTNSSGRHGSRWVHV
jgi:hypothetical protein